MELISIALARSIWLFDLNDLNPSGKSIFPDAFSWLAEKYAFNSFPKSIDEVDQEKKGYLFKSGSFQTHNGKITVNLSIYTDGLVAETWASTEASDAFLNEVLKGAIERFGLAFKPEIIRKKQYVSELVVHLKPSIASLDSRINRFCKMLNDLFAVHQLPPFELTGLVCSPDTSATSYKPPGFMIERKQGVPFSENRYWSKSPFATKDHLRVLREFEKLLSE